MQHFQGLDLLIKGVVGKEINEWVFVNVKQLQQNIMTADYYIFPQDEIWALDESEVYETEQGSELPVKVKEKNLEAWLEVGDVEGVISYLGHYHESPSLTQISKALQYYYENDAFTDLSDNQT